MLILWIVIAAAITACEWVSAIVTVWSFGGGRWLRLASVLVLLIGIIIRWTAIFTLGKAFSANVAIRKQQRLKQTGLYRFVRHPSYSGLLLILLAVGLHSQLGRTFGADDSCDGCAYLPDSDRRSGVS